jgi:ABC-type molybdate transport system substrate-binding protein
MSDRFSACLNSFAHLNGFKQAILNVKSIGHSNAGTEYLGPLSPDLIEYGRFGVAVRNVSKNQNEARALIAFMTSPEAAPLLRKTAMEPPKR